jgi:hypothetical protein
MLSSRKSSLKNVLNSQVNLFFQISWLKHFLKIETESGWLSFLLSCGWLSSVLNKRWSLVKGGGWVMVLNATFNNISVILWRSVLLVQETGVTGENHLPAASR